MRSSRFIQTHGPVRSRRLDTRDGKAHSTGGDDRRTPAPGRAHHDREWDGDLTGRLNRPRSPRLEGARPDSVRSKERCAGRAVEYGAGDRTIHRRLERKGARREDGRRGQTNGPASAQLLTAVLESPGPRLRDSRERPLRRCSSIDVTRRGLQRRQEPTRCAACAG
jgi:hypothetical protein